ncbi:hypothetical protein M3Y99_01283000 [Aphelenchoides fujianensis]|nr:hypothetical protein M3Y99_01283000 [Aphelenchoides fujianensis]
MSNATTAASPLFSVAPNAAGGAANTDVWVNIPLLNVSFVLPFISGSTQNVLYSPYEFALLGITIVTVAAQLYVAFLLRFKTPPTMRDYRYFLVLFTLWDGLFTVWVGLVVQPVPIEGIVAVTLRGLANYFQAFWCRVLVAGSVFFGVNVVLAQNLCALHRFLALQPTSRAYARFRSPTVHLGIQMAIQAVAGGLALLFYATFKTAARIAVHKQSGFLRERLVATDGTAARINDRFIWLETEFVHTQLFLVAFLLLFVASPLFSLGVLLATVRSLRKGAAYMPAATRQLHAQFLRLLFVQIASPLLFAVLPVLVCCGCILVGVGGSRLSFELVFGLLALYGLSNALSSVCFIQPYRQFTAALLWDNPLGRLLCGRKREPKEKAIRVTPLTRSFANTSPFQ